MLTACRHLHTFRPRLHNTHSISQYTCFLPSRSVCFDIRIDFRLQEEKKMATKEVAQELIQRHPLQRLESPSRGASALLHVSRKKKSSISRTQLIRSTNKIFPDNRPRLLRLLILLPRPQPEPNVSKISNRPNEPIGQSVKHPLSRS